MTASEQLTDDVLFFANDEEQSEGIYTRQNPGGTTIKQVTLPDSKLVAITRKAIETDYAKVVANLKSKNKGKRLMFLIALCSTLDGKSTNTAVLGSLTNNDFKKLAAAFSSINF